jgi:DNA-directed RNA polymerase subunit M/transcription elongation factor TFIIS
MPSDFNPLVYFWIAFYNDGSCLPQFDFETGKTNDFKDVDQYKLVKFGLFPFPKDLSEKANKNSGFEISKVCNNLPYFLQILQRPRRLIYTRRNFIHQFSYQHCMKCGYTYQWMPNHVEMVGEVGLPIHQNYIMEYLESQGKTFPLPQCPKCKSINHIVCPDCKVLINELKTSPDDKTPRKFECPKCKREYPRYIITRDSEIRKTIYLLGYQETTENISGKDVNKKFILFINEDGTIEMSDNYNYK